MPSEPKQPGVSARRHAQVVNLDEVAGHAAPPDGPYAATMKPLAAMAGGSAIGCTYFEVPAGRSGFPLHYHCVNEEAIYLLEGEGQLRLGEREVPVRTGDYLAFPVGPASAHQLRNTGAGPLRYLCFSTMQPTDVSGYPETNSLAIMAASSTEAARRGETWVSTMVPAGGPPPAK